MKRLTVFSCITLIGLVGCSAPTPYVRPSMTEEYYGKNSAFLARLEACAEDGLMDIRVASLGTVYLSEVINNYSFDKERLALLIKETKATRPRPTKEACIKDAMDIYAIQENKEKLAKIAPEQPVVNQWAFPQLQKSGMTACNKIGNQFICSSF